jgi:hypothetical protein
MLNLRNCVAEGLDDYNVIGVIEHAHVMLNGGTASLWEWDRKQRRYVQVDRLKNATSREVGDGYVISGKSRMFAKQIGLGDGDQIVSFRVNPRACKDC